VKVVNRVGFRFSDLWMEIIPKEGVFLRALIVIAVFNPADFRFGSILRRILVAKYLLHYQKGAIGEYDTLRDGSRTNTFEGVR
jgi:hypothetical protein